jgi:hypothetical protein
VIQPTPFRALQPLFTAQRFLARGRQFRRVAIPLADMEGPEPNWPKYFLLTHAIELAIRAYLAFRKDIGAARPPGPEPANHDLVGLYEQAVICGLKRNTLVTAGLPHISELHEIHYARYPRSEARPVALISQYDDLADELFADVGNAIGP